MIISQSTAHEYVSRVRVAVLAWPLHAELDTDEALTGMLLAKAGVVKVKRALDWVSVHAELKKKLVTK